MTKECTKCKEIKDISLFYKSKNKPLGIQSNCKECQNIATTKWRNGNGKEAYKSYKKSPESYEKHKIRNKKRAQKYRDTLNDNYVRALICMKSDLKQENITQELIDLWKINLKLKRELRDK